MQEMKLYLIGRIAHYYDTLLEIHTMASKLYDELLDSIIGSPIYYELNDRIKKHDLMVDSIVTRIDECNDILKFIHSLENK